MRRGSPLNVTRCALFAVAAVAFGSQPASAQRPTCYTIRSGDTAASLALRFAGDADQRHQTWFQIFDPVRSRYVPKARYDVIRPGWLACIFDARGGAPPVTARIATTEHAPSTLSRIAQSLAGFQPDYRWCLVILLLTLPFAWRIGNRHWRGRRVIIEEMTQFGETFIREFERPLVEPHISAPALKSRLRFKPHRGRLEILLAPGIGRRYPNLLDHRKNVEYDMERVLLQLRDEPFVSGSPRQQGQWVVVPFRVKASQKVEGIL